VIASLEIGATEKFDTEGDFMDAKALHLEIRPKEGEASDTNALRRSRYKMEGWAVFDTQL